MEQAAIDFSALEKALASLEDAVMHDPANDLERDGVIQRFEYTFEICWKMIRRVLLSLGRAQVSASPKPLLRDALEEGFIEKIEPWFAFLEARNLTTHTYNAKQAREVFEVARTFPAAARQLLEQLATKSYVP